MIGVAIDGTMADRAGLAVHHVYAESVRRYKRGAISPLSRSHNGSFDGKTPMGMESKRFWRWMSVKDEVADRVLAFVLDSLSTR